MDAGSDTSIAWAGLRLEGLAHSAIRVRELRSDVDELLEAGTVRELQAHHPDPFPTSGLVQTNSFRKSCHNIENGLKSEFERMRRSGIEQPPAHALLSHFRADQEAVVLHAGDSRLYRLRKGRLDQLTRDHTVIADLIRAGELGEEDAQIHPHRFVLTRALGVGPTLEIDHVGVSCESDDRLMLCSDGLPKEMSPNELKLALASDAPPQDCADNLVTTAVERGAEDNVTALLVDVH